MFITAVDKAYNIRCFYMESDKTVNADFDVSMGADQHEQILVMLGAQEKELASLVDRIRRPNASDPLSGIDYSQLTTAVITQSIPMPACKYEVLQDQSPSSPVVKFATVGQTVYHRWSCEGGPTTDGIFCMTVHSCFVNDNQGREVQLLDESGCALDRFVLKNLRYTEDMVGGQSTMVFKFADQNSLFFQCQIRLSLKEENICRRTSDNCPEPSRGKRSVKVASNQEPVGENVDVFSDSITVFDIDEPINDELDSQEVAALNRRTQARRNPDFSIDTDMELAQMCLSPITFGILLAVLGLVLLASIVSVCLLCFKRDAALISPLKALG